jgi:predicted nucleotidyltransferase
VTVTSLIKNIARQLDGSRIPYMIIGGQAVLLYGRARLTRDIDITLGVNTDQFARVEQMCKKIGLKLLPEDPNDFTAKTNVLPAEELQSKIRVDFIFSFTPYEAQAIAGANRVLLEDYTVRFATCEDVIIHKMVAARPIDHEDVRHLVAKHHNTIDLSYLRHWLSEFSQLPGYENVLRDFEELWNRQSGGRTAQ